MPSVDIHCEMSKQRTGEEFKELHEWIDAPQEFLGVNHRIERHAFNEPYKEFIKNKWGEKAVVEWLFHIALDNLETANKIAFGVYHKPYDKIQVNFEKDKIVCEFAKTHKENKV